MHIGVPVMLPFSFKFLVKQMTRDICWLLHCSYQATRSKAGIRTPSLRNCKAKKLIPPDLTGGTEKRKSVRIAEMKAEIAQ